MLIKVDRSEMDQIPAWMRASLEGQGYTLQVGVEATLLNMAGENGETTLSKTPLMDQIDKANRYIDLPREADKTGANP